MESGDRRERTVYVSGMHPSVTEDVLYDLFQQVGPVEKVVLHEYPDGSPRHALVVFNHVESVMYSIGKLNGTPVVDRPLAMRPLRESTHAQVFQQMVSGQPRAPMQMLNQRSVPPTPPTSPIKDYTIQDYKSPLNDAGSDVSSATAGLKGPRALNQLQSTPLSEDRAPRPPRDTQMWKKYTMGASSAATGGISDWFPATPPTAYAQGFGADSHMGVMGGSWGGVQGGQGVPGVPPPGFCGPIYPGFNQPRYQGRHYTPYSYYDHNNQGGQYHTGGSVPGAMVTLPHTAAYYSGINGNWAK